MIRFTASYHPTAGSRSAMIVALPPSRGTLTLSSRPEGGLRAIVVLPFS
jgi:hypothetical protein